MTQFSFSNLFSSSYWFGKPLTLAPAGLWIMMVVFGVLTLIALFCTYRFKYETGGLTRGMWRRFALWGWTMAVLGWFILFARYEKMLLFRRRFWFALWFLGGVWWLYRLSQRARKRLPALSAQAHELALKARYLPKRKQKK